MRDFIFYIAIYIYSLLFLGVSIGALFSMDVLWNYGIVLISISFLNTAIVYVANKYNW